MKYLLIFSLIIYGCKSSYTDSKEEQMTIENPQIIFLNYLFENQAPLPHKVSIQNIQKVAGTFKQKQQFSHTSVSQSRYKCTVKSKTNVILYEEHFDDPLQKTVEFFNEDNSLQKKSITLDSVVFNLRIQLPQKSHCIEITNPMDRLLLRHDL